MQTLAVVIDPDILKEDDFGFLVGGKHMALHALGLEGSPHRFHECIIPTVPIGAHARSDALVDQKGAVSL
jgi:hypothetical protein